MRLVTTFIQNTESTDPDLSYLNRARFVLSVADGHGSDGVGILDAVIRNRHLFLSMTSGAEIDAGSVFTEDDLPVASDSRLGIAAFDPAYFSILAGKVSLRGDLDFGLNETQLAEYLTANKYATQAWVAAQGFIGSDGLALYATKEWVLGQNFAKASSLGNYLLKSVWDEVFEVTTVNGVRVLNVKLDIAGLKGISAYGLGSTSGSGASGSLGELVNVGQWADEVPTADRVMVQLAGATHWSAKPLADLVGLDTAALAQYLTANSYLKASDISSYLTWANLSGKPTVYPTSWELVVGRPTKLSDLTDDVVAGNYLPKSTWDAVFEVVTVDGTPALKVKYDILGLKGISAYGLGSTSGGSASGSLGELVNVGQWADAVPTADRVMVQLAGATHWSAKPLADLVGLDTAALAQYLTANSYLKASDISSYLTWANLSGKPTVYPTSWELVADKPTVYPTAWTSVTGRPTKLSQFTDDVVAGNYLPKPTWDAVFEVVTVDGTPVLKVKYDILGLKGITAYADGTLSGGFSGALVDLVDVAVTNLASGDILKYNGTHFVNVPVSSIAGASSWDQITGKPEYYPTRWADVSGAPTSLPASDVYPWAKAASKPTYTAAEVGALALSGGTLTGNVITIGSFILANSGAYPQLTFRATADNSERLLFRHGNDLKWRYNGTNDGIIYHSGNFNPSSKLDKSVWDEAFEIKTVDGVRVISAKLDFLSVAGISAYATGPSSGGGGGGLDYDLLKQALTGAITPDGYPFTISASFLGAIDKTYLTGKLANTYADKVHTHLWANITDRPTALPANGGNADTVDNLHASSFAQIKSYTYPDGGINNITDLDFTGNIQAHFPGHEYSCIWQGKDFRGVIFQLKLKDYYTQSMMYRGGETKTWRTVWDSGNFNPDSKLGVSSVAVEAKKMSYQGLMTAISGTTTFPAGLYLYGVYSNGYPVTYGNLLRVGGSGLGEMLFGWAGDASVGGLYYRSKRDVAATAWSSWCKLWTSANSNLSTIDWSANNLNAAANLDVAGQAYVSGWLRSRGNVGWYSQDYGGGIHMTDSTWVRVYGSKGLMIDTGTSPFNMGQLQITCSAEASIGFRSASNGNWCLGKGVSSIGSGFGLYNAATNRVAFQIASATDNASFVGSITAPTFVGNLSGSASSVNGYDINSFTGYYKYTIDASSLDQNTYYPVTMNLGAHNTVRISVIVALNSGTKPAWSSHASGFSVRFIEEVNGSGWGISEVSRNILANEYRFANANPVGRVEQMTNSSTEVIWVRGGGKYFFYLSIPYITPALCTSTFTTASQSVSPRTDTMDLRTAALGSGIAINKLYAHNSIEINGFTIDVYNGALRVNGNLVATGGVTSLATA